MSLPTVKLSGPDQQRIALRAGRSIKTVIRVYQGLGNAYSRSSVTSAAKALGLPIPPEPETADTAE